MKTNIYIYIDIFMHIIVIFERFLPSFVLHVVHLSALLAQCPVLFIVTGLYTENTHQNHGQKRK